MSASEIETIGEIVVLGRRILLQLPASDVMIGQEQSVWTHERARSAVIEPHARKAQMVKPRLRRHKAVFFLEQLQRRIVEGPHALFGMKRGRQDSDEWQGAKRKNPLLQEGTEIHRHPEHLKCSL